MLENLTALFAGRHVAFKKIAEFIRQPAGGYLVVTAPAGFGKTALMANLVSGTPEAFAYHFFSPYTNASSVTEVGFLENVVEQMAQLHGLTEELPNNLPDLQALYHKFIDEKLERTQVLVLDGLDEVTTWKLHRYLSRRLPENLHIILTVRDVGQDWANDYQLPDKQFQHLPLGGLTRDDVVEVLRKAGQGATVFADNAKLLDEVMRVSAYQDDETLGADPFYVRLLAEDAADERLTPANIGDQPKGLDNYLDVWWQNLKEVTKKSSNKEKSVPVKDLLGTLTVTLGPIGRIDMEKINPSLEDDWEADFFNEVLNEVRRFVFGNEEQGYALVHPRLRQYMHSKIKTGKYSEKLLKFCDEWQEHKSRYALTYYAQHLVEAGCSKDLHDLLAQETSNRRNAWYEAKEEIGDLAGFVADVSLAWQQAENEFHQDLGVAIGLQCRYALITTSINSLAGNIFPELIATLLEKEIWKPEQGIAYIQQCKDSSSQAEGLEAIIKYLPDSLLPKALEAARAIESESDRATALKRLAPHLSENLLTEALEAARAIENERWQAEVLQVFASHFPKLLDEALETTKAIKDEFYRASTLTDLATHFPQLLPEALETAKAIKDESNRGTVLRKLAPYYPELLPEALEALEATKGPLSLFRAFALTNLAAHFPKLLPEALKEVKQMGTNKSISVLAYGYGMDHMGLTWRVWALKGLAPHLTKDLLPEALEIVKATDYVYQPRALRALAPYLTENLLSEALEVARGMWDESTRTKELQILAPYLPEALPEALEASRSIRSESTRTKVLQSLAPYLPEALDEALESARTIDYNYDRANALQALVPYFPTILPEALEAFTLESDYSRYRALKDLAPYLTENSLPQALEIAINIGSEFNRADALIVLTPYLTENLLPKALEAARNIKNKRWRAKALQGLAPYFTEVNLLSEALESVKAIDDERFQFESIHSLARDLPELLPEALKVAQAIMDKNYRAYALTSLVSDLPKVLPEALEAISAIASESDNINYKLKDLAPYLNESLFPKALELTRSIRSESDRARALECLAPHLSENLLTEALEIAKAMREEIWQGNALKGLAPHLSENLSTKALEVAKAIRDESRRGWTLKDLAPHLSENLLTDALEAAISIRDHEGRATALQGLVPYFPNVLPEALEAAKAIRDESDRSRALRRLAPHLSENLLTDALEAAKTIRSENRRADALTGLAPYLSEDLLTDALEAARAIGSEYSRTSALNSLIEKLISSHVNFLAWQKILRIIDSLKRNDFLNHFPKLAPLIIQLGGPEALRETVIAVKDVSQWWK